jgi:hypothetical protein
MSHYIIVTDEEYQAIQAYHFQIELERVRRVLAYWEENPIGGK